MELNTFCDRIRGKLIVSCQALPHEPLHGPETMVKMAQAAHQGGAVAIRANSPADVEAIKAAVALPLIGLYKHGDEGVYITPTIAHALEIVAAGADVVAIDATDRPRPNGDTLRSQIQAVHDHGALVLADVSTLAEGKLAAAAGADLVAPTLSGYTPHSPKLPGPDFALIQALAQELTLPVIAEGRIHTPQDAVLALQYGAIAVVVGSAITRPQLITQGFAQAIASL